MIKKIAIQVLKIGISAFLVFFLLKRVGLVNMTDAIGGADPLWLLLALTVYGLSHFVGSYQWYILMHSQRIEIPLLGSITGRRSQS